MTIEDKDFLMRQLKSIGKGFGQIVGSGGNGGDDGYLEIFLNDPANGEVTPKTVLKQLILENKFSVAKNYWSEIKPALPENEQKMIEAWLKTQIPE